MGGIGSGGARENAGRPRIDTEARETVTLTLPPRLLRHLREAAGQKGVSVSQMVTDLLESRN